MPLLKRQRFWQAHFRAGVLALRLQVELHALRQAKSPAAQARHLFGRGGGNPAVTQVNQRRFAGCWLTGWRAEHLFPPSRAAGDSAAAGTTFSGNTVRGGDAAGLPTGVITYVASQEQGKLNLTCHGAYMG